MGVASGTVGWWEGTGGFPSSEEPLRTRQVLVRARLPPKTQPRPPLSPKELALALRPRQPGLPGAGPQVDEEPQQPLSQRRPALPPRPASAPPPRPLAVLPAPLFPLAWEAVLLGSQMFSQRRGCLGTTL